MGDTFTCKNCGKPYSVRTGSQKWATTFSGGGFCCQGCADEYLIRSQQAEAIREQNAARKEAAKEAKKQAKKEAKEAPKREKIANAKITSDKSLSDISKKCLTLGLLGVHRFAVGKFFSGLCMPGLVVFAIAMAVSNKDPGMLLIALGDVFWWLYDLCRIKAKMFTDKSGHTVREG